MTTRRVDTGRIPPRDIASGSRSESPPSGPPAPATTLGREKSDHFVLFYDSDAWLEDALAHFLARGLDSGGAGVLFATEKHAAGVEEELRRRGLDLASLATRGRYQRYDAAWALSQIQVGGSVDEASFRALLEPILTRAAATGAKPPLRLFGELVALLWSQGKGEEALRLEKLWNDLGRRHQSYLFCAYPTGLFVREAEDGCLVAIHEQHERVLTSERAVPTAEEERRRLLRADGR